MTHPVWGIDAEGSSTRAQLMSEVWDQNWGGSTKTLAVTIGRRRKKLEAAGVVDHVVALRCVALRLESSARSGDAVDEPTPHKATGVAGLNQRGRHGRWRPNRTSPSTVTERVRPGVVPARGWRRSR